MHWSPVPMPESISSFSSMHSFEPFCFAVLRRASSQNPHRTPSQNLFGEFTGGRPPSFFHPVGLVIQWLQDVVRYVVGQVLEGSFLRVHGRIWKMIFRLEMAWNGIGWVPFWFRLGVASICLICCTGSTLETFVAIHACAIHACAIHACAIHARLQTKFILTNIPYFGISQNRPPAIRHHSFLSGNFPFLWPSVALSPWYIHVYTTSMGSSYITTYVYSIYTVSILCHDLLQIREHPIVCQCLTSFLRHKIRMNMIFEYL